MFWPKTAKDMCGDESKGIKIRFIFIAHFANMFNYMYFIMY